MNLRLTACHALALVALIQPVWAQGGPPGGRVSTILTAPSDGNLLYIATNAGILRSRDGGFTWSPARGGLTSLDTTTIAGEASLLYAGTFGAGVFRSRDGGESWQPITQGLSNLDVLSLAVDPSDANTVYAGTSNGGVFKTTTAGDQWSSSSQGLPQGNYTDLAVDPNNSQVVYAAQANLGLAAGTGNLFRSSNGGQSWAAAAGPAVTAVALAPSDSNTVYVGTISGIVRTTNAGQSFEPRTLIGFQIGDIAVDPDDANTVYATTPGSGVLKSTDGGVTWFANPAGLPRTELVALAINSSDPSILYTGSNGAGIFRSADSGTTWQLTSNGLFATDSRAFAIDPVAPSNLLAGIFGGGLFRSSNGGRSWAESRQGLATLRVEAIAIDPVNPATVYAGSSNPFNPSNGSFFRSTDGGREWELRATGFPVFTVVAHPRDGRTVYIGTDGGVFRTTDGGATFSDASGDNGELDFLTNVDFAIDPNNPDTLFAVSLNSFSFPNFYEVFRSRDAGRNWRGAGVTEVPLLTVAVDPTDSSRVWVGSALGLFRSTDGGERFARVPGGLPNEGAVLVSSFAFDVNDNGTIYAATSQGVYKSTDRGDNWQAATAGLEGLVLRSLTADPKNARVLYAATANGGVFKTLDGGASWQPTGGLTLVIEGGIVGGADFIGGGVAPGEIVSIFGQNIGPAQGVTTVFDEAGKLPTSAAGVTVFFGEWRAPLFFVSDRQINVQVPFEVAGLEQVEVRVEIGGVTSNVASVAVIESHPGVFQAALNQDNRVNSERRPAGRGSVVQLFVTGQGVVSPAILTGEPGPLTPPFPVPSLPVSVTIGGEPARVLFRGLAPGFVGVLQINARLSTRLGSGPAEVVVTIGERVSAVAGTVFVE